MFVEGTRMGLDTKSLEELELLARNLREQFRLDPEHKKLELDALREVEYWVELRRQEDEAEVPVGWASETPFLS